METSTPLIVDGWIFAYMIEWTPGEWQSLLTWFWGGVL
jgi:hypothetical protein